MPSAMHDIGTRTVRSTDILEEIHVYVRLHEVQPLRQNCPQKLQSSID
jgi:hypothetical protein